MNKFYAICNSSYKIRGKNAFLLFASALYYLDVPPIEHFTIDKSQLISGT